MITGLLALATWLTGIGGSIVLLYSGVRYFLQWPTTEAILLSGDDGTGECRLRVINDGPTHIQIQGIAVLWPRRMRIGIQEHGKADQDWEAPPKLPVDWKTSLPAAVVVGPKSEATISFLASDFSSSLSNQFILIKLFSARFVARKSWKAVKTLHMQTETKTKA
jgi:hypothetical protein